MIRIFILLLFSLYSVSLMSMDHETAGIADTLSGQIKVAVVEEETGIFWYTPATEEGPIIGETITVVVHNNNESYPIEGEVIAIITPANKHAHLH